MRVLADFIMRGRLPAMSVAAISAALSVVIPPLLWLSGAALALVALRRGLADALMVTAGATALSAALLLGLAGNPLPALLMALTVWLPLLLLAGVLRNSVSLARCLQTGAAMALVLLGLLHVGLGDAAGWWRGVLDRVLVKTMQDAGLQTGGADFDAAMELLAGMMSGLLLSSWLLTLVISLLLARAWHALQVNPGGLRQEFHALRLGTPLAIVAVVVLLLTLLGGQAYALDALLILSVVFVLQGLAVIHAVFAQRGIAGLWLIPLYVLLVFAMPQTASLLALLGLLDNVVDVRARFARAPTGEDR